MRIGSVIPIAVMVYVGASASARSGQEDLVGKYKGIIWSNSDRPGTTTFFISAGGRIAGTYVFEDATGPETGRLLDCRLSLQTLTCHWQDKYGSGDWYGNFSADYKSFKGGWFDARGKLKKLGYDNGYRWNGTKE